MQHRTPTRSVRALTETDAAIRVFLARYTGETVKRHGYALERFRAWFGPDILTAKRADVELYVRDLTEVDGLARSTAYGYLSTLSTFYKVALADGRISIDPTVMVRKPKVYHDPNRLTGLTRHDFEKLILLAHDRSPKHAALVMLLGGLGLRASEAANVRIEDYSGWERGHRVLKLVGKGGKPATIAIPPLVARALDACADGRTEGPLLLTRTGGPITRHNVFRWIRVLGHQAGLGDVKPHDLRHSFATIALDSGASLREVQDAGRWADIRMVERYDRNRTNLDRHAAYKVSAHLSGIADRLA